MFSEGDRVRYESAAQSYFALVLETKRDMWTTEVHILPEDNRPARWVDSGQLTMVRADANGMADCPRCGKSCRIGPHSSAHCTNCFSGFRVDD